MQGGKRVIETFPSSAALNRSFRAARRGRTWDASARRASITSSFTWSGSSLSIRRWTALRLTRSARPRGSRTYPRSTVWLISFQSFSRIVLVCRRKSVKWTRNPPSEGCRSRPSSCARDAMNGASSRSRRAWAHTASVSAYRRIRYWSARHETIIRATGDARISGSTSSSRGGGGGGRPAPPLEGDEHAVQAAAAGPAVRVVPEQVREEDAPLPEVRGGLLHVRVAGEPPRGHAPTEGPRAGIRLGGRCSKVRVAPRPLR